MRIGHGYDVHRFAENRRLVIGGAEIPFEKGLLGHSDADVLLHAVCDALLGAAALGDIGRHFPDTDPAFLNIDSRILLKKTAELLREKGLVLHRPYVGRYACSMEMQGMSLSLMKLDDELKRLLDAPADSPFFKQF